MEGKDVLKIDELYMNYEKNLYGVQEWPSFSWVATSDKRNVLQEAYQFQLSKNENFENCIYDSGKIESDMSSQIFVSDVEMEAVCYYYARVKIWSKHGEESAWSQAAQLLTGIVNKEWEAKFISAEKKEDANDSKSTYVKQTYEAKGKIQKAFACTSALGIYKLYINGKRVGEDEMAPGWTSYKKHLLYQTYDITKYLEEGENTFGAFLGAGWYKGVMGFRPSRNHYGDRTAFIGEFCIRYEDGSEEIYKTDETWIGADGPIIFSEIYDGETYDESKEIKNWCSATSGNEWSSIEVEPFDVSVLRAQGAGKIKIIETLPVKEIFETPKGETVIDFGQNMTGWVRFRTEAQAGDEVELQFFEVLDADGNVYTDNLRTAKQIVKYHVHSAGEVEYEPHFTFQGFQYVRIIKWPNKPKAENFTACVVHSDMKRTGYFESSNAELNQLHHNLLWGLKGNFLDVPTDCPQRDERLGWTGDAQIFCGTADYLMNTYTFFDKWLEDVAADQLPDGAVAHVVPDILTGRIKDGWQPENVEENSTYGATAWADAITIMPWDIYKTYGDKRILEKRYANMKLWIEYMKFHAEDYVWNHGLQFGDWVALDAKEGSYFGATPNELTCTAYFAYSTKIIQKVATVLGKKEDAKEYGALHKEIVRSFQKTFFDENGIMKAQTQTAHILALHFELVKEEYKEKTAQNLVKLLKKENGHLVTGFVGTPYFCHALSNNGYLKEAYELLFKDDFPSWLYQVKAGATTIWEHWDGKKPDGSMWSPDMNSFNHYAYGAIGEWIYKTVVGIVADENEPGYKKILIQPRPTDKLSYVKGGYQSVHGLITVNWEKCEKDITLHVEIPVNTTATIKLEEVDHMVEVSDISFKEENQCFCAEIGSGKYTMKYKMI
jgi:Alpha-L-rhamnosidase N-terminal domain./Bacterial alpha-L-rhamnosidase.